MFSELWCLIAIRQGDPREKARGEFDRALADGADPDAMLRGGEVYSDYMRDHPDERRYAVAAARWLRERRWEDWQEPPSEPKQRLPGLF